ncbi:tetrapyrrole (Corrin/Porphyrin) Methylases family protein [[Clostridium] sordellii ATCC 9714]|nr:tetrapyrrole (Corrin/Porphyrin) Methylases family protein [[Clostridium] sordellii ATCC 9714] [Paeniclostridium sordellii ATCC 9714]
MGKITIVGLGPGEYSLISQGALEILRNNDRIFLRTEKHPIMDKLKNEIKYKSLDNFYNEDEDFDNVYNNISNFIIEESKNGDLVYVVPGHPRVAEKTVSIISDIASKKGIEVEIIASMSFVDAMFNYLGLDPSVGFKLVDAFEIENSYIDTNTSMIITQIYDRFIASNVKLALMECYDDEQEICIVRAAGVKNLESKKYVKLYELDRNENDFDYLTSLYIPKSEKTMYNTVKDLEN